MLLRREPWGGYIVTVPSLPGCVTYGATLDQARAAAEEAVEFYAEGLRARGAEGLGQIGSFNGTRSR
ncbi:MAG: type II toxin-antitoxin system HicB family antitoxin [candidate division WOR-3 bacterium]|nr:type II toxin-antitoxin system HicB family antitoxin [candidate division WOR-3 bacterium]